MTKIAVGDAVEVVNTIGIYNSDIKVGMKGKVVHIHNDEPSIGVEFDTYIDGHSCEEHCNRYRGWYIEERNLTAIQEGIFSLHKTKWVELCERVSNENGRYIFIREPWLIDGKAVSILPFNVDDNGEITYLLRHEVADVPVVGTIKGGCDKEGESLSETAVRELEEEAGYKAFSHNMIYLGTARSSKLNTTTMHLFAINVKGLDFEEPKGDGTANEANAYCMWVDEETAIASQDPMIHASMLRLSKIALKVRSVEDGN